MTDRDAYWTNQRYDDAAFVAAETYDLPLPGDALDGGTVVASVWMDDDGDAPTALFVLLRPAPPYYSVVEATAISGGDWSVDDKRDHRNINYAVTDYADSGGDV